MVQKLRVAAALGSGRAQSGTEAVLRALACVFLGGASPRAGDEVGQTAAQVHARREARLAALKAYRVHFHVPGAEGGVSPGPTLSFWCMSPGAQLLS